MGGEVNWMSLGIYGCLEIGVIDLLVNINYKFWVDLFVKIYVWVSVDFFLEYFRGMELTFVRV